MEAYSQFNELLSNFKDKKHIANEIWGKDYTPKEERSQAELASDEILKDDSVKGGTQDAFSRLSSMVK